MRLAGHSLAVGSRSIIGQVTATGKTIVVNNTAVDPLHRPNPLLPQTRAEAGIPLKIGDRVVGAIDLQSDETGAFKQEDLSVLEILADQVAVALENARSYNLAQKAMEEMRETDRIKSQFLANMSHELRTPLNSIIGFSRVILKGIDGPINEQQQQDLSAIYNSGQHLLGLINDILDLSKIDAGKMELAFDEINMGDTIHSVMSTAVGLVKDKPIRLQEQVEENLPPVRADSMRLRQVLLNLISNAAKFTEQGTIVVSASLHTNSLGKQEVMVSVTDSGPGISIEDQDKLFKPFSQVDSSPTRKTGGTGLGLSISHRLVELHGGRIGVHSTVGKGSTFYFTVPVFAVKPVLPEFGDGKIILCIDDDAQVINLYDRYLTPQGYHVVALTDPTKACEVAKDVKPFAITLDIMMPGYDGWQVINDLKKDKATQDFPVIICSIVEEEEKGFSLGAADYLVKPILEEDLVNSLNRLNGDGSIKEVLVIDDDPNDLRLVEKILDDHSRYKAVLAEGGLTGWEMLTAKPPQAIILDLFMPDLDGFTILERMRSTPLLRDIPVVVISGVDLNPEQRRQLENLGKRLLQKGMLSEEELFATLEKALNRLEAKKPAEK
jgi:signal transduction histidine kinase/CheY-like chemotaxis protein